MWNLKQNKDNILPALKLSSDSDIVSLAFLFIQRILASLLFKSLNKDGNYVEELQSRSFLQDF